MAGRGHGGEGLRNSGPEGGCRKGEKRRGNFGGGRGKKRSILRGGVGEQVFLEERRVAGKGGAGGEGGRDGTGREREPMMGEPRARGLRWAALVFYQRRGRGGERHGHHHEEEDVPLSIQESEGLLLEAHHLHRLRWPQLLEALDPRGYILHHQLHAGMRNHKSLSRPGGLMQRILDGGVWREKGSDLRR